MSYRILRQYKCVPRTFVSLCVTSDEYSIFNSLKDVPTNVNAM